MAGKRRRRDKATARQGDGADGSRSSSRPSSRVADGQSDRLVGMLVAARSMSGRPIPDALMIAALAAADAVQVATFDRDQRRYGIAAREL